MASMTWEEAIQKVLAEAEGPLHYAAIADQIVEQGLREKPGPTPASTVASYLSQSLARGGSPYVRTEKGMYTLHNKQVAEAAPAAQAAHAAVEQEQPETGAIRAFGMFWLRDGVNWAKAKPPILGNQGQNTEPVDFAGQVGVYLLHDRDRVIYVGRATDSMHTRLRAHTSDRLAGRWDRFSWFGLRRVGPDGKLQPENVPWGHTVVIETMEALLIESLEPPLNRKRGDYLGEAEFLQVPDPELAKDKAAAEIIKKLLGGGAG